MAHFFRVASVLGFFFQKIQLEMFSNVGRYYGPKFQRILAKLEEIMIRLGYFDVFATFWPLFQSCISFGVFFFSKLNLVGEIFKFRQLLGPKF